LPLLAFRWLMPLIFAMADISPFTPSMPPFHASFQLSMLFERH
jgi:hypothetical protein